MPEHGGRDGHSGTHKGFADLQPFTSATPHPTRAKKPTVVRTAPFCQNSHTVSKQLTRTHHRMLPRWVMRFGSGKVPFCPESVYTLARVRVLVHVSSAAVVLHAARNQRQNEAFRSALSSPVHLLTLADDGHHSAPLSGRLVHGRIA